MADSLIFYLVLGLLIGMVLVWLLLRNRVSAAELHGAYVPRTVHEELQRQAERLKEEGIDQRLQIQRLNDEAARAAADLDDVRHELEQCRTQLRDEQRQLQTAKTEAATVQTSYQALSSRLAETSAEREQLRQINRDVGDQLATLRLQIQRSEVEASQAQKDAAEARQQLEQTRLQLHEETKQHQSTHSALTQTTANFEALTARLADQKAEFDQLRASARDEFINLSNKLLKDSGEHLRAAHSEGLEQLLKPVRVKLTEFQETVERKFTDEGKDKAVLRTQIEQLTTLNQDLSREARQLTQALKGDTKTQGDWGEQRLQGLLEAAGLVEGTHFDTQAHFTLNLAEGQPKQRPDCIVHLPQRRCLVIDAKVSLTAYERFCGSETDLDTKLHLKQHVQSLRTHITGLSAKRYQDIYQIDCPDYVLMFVPLEPAFITAVRERGSLFTEALEANVVLVSPSTLLATMRTVSYIWQQEDQRENAQHIAEVGRKLYDKFVGFVDDMESVGKQLSGAQTAYDAAMNKLSRSPKTSTTLVARANELRALGVAGKRLLTEEADLT